MKKKALFMLVFTTALLFVLCGCNSGTSYAHAAQYTAGNGEVASITNLDIEWISGEVNISYGETEKVLFSETVNQTLAEVETMHWWQDGTTLRIKFAKSGYHAQNTPQKKLNVTLPQSTTLYELDVEAVSADVTVNGISATKMEIESVSGNISVSEANATQELDLKTVSGNIQATLLKLPTELDLKTVSGDGTLTLATDAAFFAEFETVSGNFSCAFGEPVKTGKKYTITVAGAASKIEAETVSGNFTIQKK